MFKKSSDDLLKFLNELSQTYDSGSSYILPCIKTKMEAIRKTKIKDAVSQYKVGWEGTWKGVYPKKMRRVDTSYVTSSWQEYKRQGASYSSIETLPKGKDREVKSLRIPRPKSQGNDAMLIIIGCRRSWSGSESYAAFHHDEKQTEGKTLIKLQLSY